MFAGGPASLVGRVVMSSMLRLSDQEPFAQGGNRLCYVDPRDSERCVKVSRPGREAAAKRRLAPGLKGYRPLVYYDDNLREYATYRRIERCFGEETWRHLPRCYGLVRTDQGEGIVTDLVRDADGAISRSLKEQLRESGVDANFREAVGELKAYLERTGLPTRDLLLHNLVARRAGEEGRFRIFIIDGFGSADVLPYVYWSRKLARRKARRKLLKFDGKIEDFCRENGLPEPGLEG